jgi:hypothetical protein
VDAVFEGGYRLMFLVWYDLALQPSHHAARASKHKLIRKCISLSTLTSYPIAVVLSLQSHERANTSSFPNVSVYLPSQATQSAIVPVRLLLYSFRLE